MGGGIKNVCIHVIRSQLFLNFQHEATAPAEMRFPERCAMYKCDLCNQHFRFF